MATISFKTNQGSGASATFYVDGDVTGATLTAEFSSNSKFGTIALTKSLTATGRQVTISLSSADVDLVKDCHFRVKSIKSGNTSYVASGTIDYASASDLDIRPATITQVVNSPEVKGTFIQRSEISESVSAANIPFVPTGKVTASNVQAAIVQAAGSAATVGARMHIAANKTITNNADTEIDFDAQSWVYGGATTNLGANSFTASVKGLYALSFSIRLYSATAGSRLVLPRVNYSVVGEFGRETAAGFEGGVAGYLPLVLNATDTVTLNVLFTQTTGTSTIVGTADPKTSWASLVLLGTVP